MVSFNVATCSVRRAPSAIIGVRSFLSVGTCPCRTLFWALASSRSGRRRAALLGSGAGRCGFRSIPRAMVRKRPMIGMAATGSVWLTKLSASSAESWVSTSSSRAV